MLSLRSYFSLENLSGDERAVRVTQWLIALLLWLVCSAMLSRDTFPVTVIEQHVLDLRYNSRPVVPIDDIVVVGITDSSLALDQFDVAALGDSLALRYMQQTFPWNRRVWAEVSQRLLDAGARMVLIDLFFANAHAGDEVFAELIEAHADRIVIGSMLYHEQELSGMGTRVVHFEPVEDLLPLTGPEVIGFVNVEPDPDGVIRRARHATWVELEKMGGVRALHSKEWQMPVWLQQQPPLLSLTALAVLKDRGLEPDQFDPDWLLPRLVDFAGPRGTFPTIPIEMLLIESDWQHRFGGGAFFKDKWVIVGPVAAVFQDLKNLPVDTLVPGAELHANLLHDLLRNRPMREASVALQVWSALLLLILLIGGGQRIHNPLLRHGLFGLGLSCWVGLTQWLWLYHQVSVPLFVSVASGTSAYLSNFGLELALERYRRRQLKQVLDRYVSANVADVILRQERKSFTLALGGEKREVVILFSDLRDFTSWSEQLDPIQLIQQLNDYFQAVVQPVLDHNGTLQKYIGDALLAVWGDTWVRTAAHNVNSALLSILAMQRALKQLNEQRAWGGQLFPLRMGIGLNSGMAVVGNLGHSQRKEFTVIGDAVNFASRLESATKYFGQTVLVSDSIREQAHSSFIFRKIEALIVKGKSEPVEVYSLIGQAPADAIPTWLGDWHQAISVFRTGDFDKAMALFLELAKGPLKEDTVCRHYLQRCSVGQSFSVPGQGSYAYELKEK